MNVALVIATAVLLIQGTRIVIRPGAQPFVRGFGVLTLLLAGLSCVLFAMLFWGEAVLSPEFDVVMARGHLRALVALVIGFAVAAGLGLHVGRLRMRLHGRLPVLLFLGLAVGATAATRITTLRIGEDTAQPFWIYVYDLWWPPLLIWLGACFVDGAITVLGGRNPRVRVGALLVMVLALSWVARRPALFADPDSARLWRLSLYLAMVGCLLFIGWCLWRACRRPLDAWRRLEAAAGRSMAAVRRHGRQVVYGGRPRLAGRLWRWTKPRAGQFLAVLAVAMIAGSLADIFYVGWLPHAGALVVLAIAWTCLAEATAQGPLKAFVVDVVPEAFGKLAHQKSWIRKCWLFLQAQLAGPLSRLGTGLGRLTSLRPFPEALMKIAVLFIVLVAAYEVPHAGKTLLQPFTALAVKLEDKVEVPTVSAQANIGHAVFHHVVNTLGALTADLQPDVILLLPPDPERGARFRTLAAGGSGTIDPFLTQGSDIDIGGVRLPLGFLLTPVLQPVRWMLGVRVVNGSVLADPQGYTVLVESSTGEMWRARLTNKDAMRALSVSEHEPAARFVTDHSFNRLALELAFRIMSAEPTLASFGMTRSWDAFEEFRGGLASWREFTLHRGLGDPDTLSSAIRHFRAAGAIDPGFALAHYRLGVALQNDGHPLAAAEALRASLKVNPGFVPAMVALASVLYSAEPELGVPAFGMPRIADDGTRPAKLHEARRLWQSVIAAEGEASALDRAAAWAGLCRYALDEPERRAQASNPVPDDAQDSRSYLIAYFHCQQAERLYAASTSTSTTDLRVKTARASELASIGMLLERYPPRRTLRPPDTWQCARATLDEDALADDRQPVSHQVRAGYYTSAALRYYRRALDLLPNDSVLRCHQAAAAFAKSGDLAPMRALESEAAFRFDLGESYRHEARRHVGFLMSAQAGHRPDREDARQRRHANLAAAYFGLAATEYGETQRRDPTNLDALNRYTQVFWEWRQAEANSRDVLAGPGLAQARQAESNARTAIAMVESKRVKPSADDESAQPGSPAAQSGLVTSTEDVPPSGAPSAALSAVARDGRGDAMPKRLRSAAAIAHAGLGAVLVAQTRPHEAIEVLERAERYAWDHPSFDHVRWMLAQAHLCAASQQFQAMRRDRQADPGSRDRDDPRLDDIAKHRDRARPQLEIVRGHERTRELAAFPGLTDISKSDRICRDDWLSSVMEQQRRPLRYEIKQVEPGSHRALCQWLGVTVQLPDGWTHDESDPVFLRVWGGAVDERVPVRDRGQGAAGRRPQRLDPIPIAETGKPFYYFAQLEDAEQTPVSRPVVLKDTRARDGAGPPTSSNPVEGVAPAVVPAVNDGRPSRSEPRCPGIKNLIQLEFHPIGSGTAHGASDGR